MDILLSAGILIFTGFLLGELAEWAKLPRISGYILAGLLLNPDLSGVMDEAFVVHTEPLLSIALAVITFSIGGALSYENLKAKGKVILTLTLFEALSAFLLVFACMALGFTYIFASIGPLPLVMAVSLLLATLAAPTDPSAALAVIHEYKARGPVSESMLEIAAFDDIVGIVLYTLVSAWAVSLLGPEKMATGALLLDLAISVGSAIGIGIAVGLLFNLCTKLFRRTTEGSLIVLTIGLVLLTYGISTYFGFEALLSTMALGAVVTNFNPSAKEVFGLMERYTDELIFVIFFALSGMHLQLDTASGVIGPIALYIVARGIGKYLGIFAGSSLMHADPKVRRYAAGGLIPQGGVVIGLALLATREAAFAETAHLIIGIVIGAALIHEIIGPLLARLSLRKAGEV